MGGAACFKCPVADLLFLCPYSNRHPYPDLCPVYGLDRFHVLRLSNRSSSGLRHAAFSYYDDLPDDLSLDPFLVQDIFQQTPS